MTNAEGGALPAFSAGAQIDLALGNGLERSFSLLNDPIETHRYVIAVLREADSGGGSVWDALYEAGMRSFKLQDLNKHWWEITNVMQSYYDAIFAKGR